MKWTYRKEQFETVPINWEEVFYDYKYPNSAVKQYFRITKSSIYLAYHTKWDKCFWLEGVGYHGNGNRLKAYMRDVYSDKFLWTEASNLELVVKL